MDPDTEDNQLIYEITAGPKHGSVEKKLQPGVAVTTFTQGRGARLWKCVDFLYNTFRFWHSSVIFAVVEAHSGKTWMMWDCVCVSLVFPICVPTFYSYIGW